MPSPQEQAQAASIRSRILHNLVNDESVPASAQAEVAIDYDEGGSVTALTFLRPSGFDSYDKAIERAIYNAAPFQLTPHIGSSGKPVRRVVFHFRKGT